MASTPNSVILSVAARYPNEVLLPFLNSLRATDYKGRVCLLVSAISNPAKAELRAWGVEVYDLDQHYGREIARYRLQGLVRLLAKLRKARGTYRLYSLLFRLAQYRASPRNRQALQHDLEKTLEGFIVLRHFHYLDYLRSHAPDADYVMLADVRDIFFQGDPFAHDLTGDLEAFLEYEKATIGKNPFNRAWLHKAFGAAGLERVASKPIACAGTTIGTRRGVERYLESTTREISRIKIPMGAGDQGIHNYLLHTGQLDPVTVFRNGYGPVATVGLDRASAERKDEQGRLVNLDGTIAAVVHQYDRYPELARTIQAQYGQR